MPNNGSTFPGADEAASMMQALINAQQRWMRQTVATMQAGGAAPPAFAEAAKQWQRIATDSVGTWSEKSEPIVRATLQRMVDSQAAMMQLFEGAVNAWRRIGEQTAEGKDLPHAIEESVEGVTEQVRRLVGTWSTATRDVQALWQRYAEDLQNAGVPFGVMMRVPGVMQERSGAADEEEGETPLRTMFDQMFKLYEYENIVERLLDTPGLGLSREFNEKVQQGFRAFQAYQRAAVRYQSIVASIWTQALQRFAYTLGERVQQGEAVADLRDLSTLWTHVADDVFVTAFRSDDYVEAQSEMLSAAMEFRVRRRALLEEYQRAIDQPTRTELDEVHELLYRLRKENKEIARVLKAQRQQRGSDAARERDVEALQQHVRALTEEARTLRAELHARRDGAAADDLTAIKGIGTATAEQLREAGFETYAALAEAPPAAVREALGRPVGDEQIAAWQRAARKRARTD